MTKTSISRSSLLISHPLRPRGIPQFCDAKDVRFFSQIYLFDRLDFQSGEGSIHRSCTLKYITFQKIIQMSREEEEGRN